MNVLAGISWARSKSGPKWIKLCYALIRVCSDFGSGRNSSFTENFRPPADVFVPLAAKQSCNSHAIVELLEVDRYQSSLSSRV